MKRLGQWRPPPADGVPPALTAWLNETMREIFVASQALSPGVQVDGNFNGVGVGQDFAISGILTPAQLTVNTNDFNDDDLPVTSVLRLSSDAARDLTGIVAPVENQRRGKVLFLVNVGAQIITLRNQNVGSTAANRFLLDADVPLGPADSAIIWYDNTTERWRALGQPTDLSGYQPLDSDLTAIAALTTTSYGRSLLESASASALVLSLLTALGNTRGMILRRGAAAWEAYAIGANGQVLASDGTDAAWTTLNAGLPPGYLFGLTLSNNGTDASNDIDVAAGKARSESDTVDLVLAAAITKRIDAAWAVGTGNGGLNTGAVAANTWYEVHLIRRSDTGVVDVMFTTTANRATLPANYDSQRRIGWVRRNSGNTALLAFSQTGDLFTYTGGSVADASATATTTTATALTLTVPPSTIARFRATLQITASTTVLSIVFSSIIEANVTPAAVGHSSLSIGTPDTSNPTTAAHFELLVNASSQIEHDASASSDGNFTINTFGWIDRRGRDA